MSIQSILLEDQFFQRGLEALSEKLGNVARKRYAKKLKVQSNKILFMTYNDDYSCNQKYIAEEIIRRGLPYELVWLGPRDQDEFRRIEHHFPPEIRVVRRGSAQAYWEMGTAKIWTENAFCFLWKKFPKKKEQVFIQTWHGAMGIKRIGMEDTKNRRWAKKGKAANQYTDYCISNSAFETDVFHETYWPDVKALEYGHARNDILFSNEEEQNRIKNRVLEYFGYPKDADVKFVLYAPTFRDHGAIDLYDIDYQMLRKNLSQKFGGEWVVIKRLHHKDAKRDSRNHTQQGVLDGTDYPDMQELMVAASAGITDYSSWAYDFVLTTKPMFIYAKDRKFYDNERGFYFSLEETPFGVAESNDQLEERIAHFDFEKYEQSRKEFLKARGSVEDGHAAERIVDLIVKEIEG